MLNFLRNLHPFRFIRRIILVAVAGGLAWGGYSYGPAIYSMVDSGPTFTIEDSELTQELVEIGQLITLEETKTGTINSKTEALFGITANSIQIDYEFIITFGVDLSSARVETIDNVVNVYIPEATIFSHKLSRIGSSRKNDFLLPISDDDVQAIIDEFENTLYNKYKNDTTYFKHARDEASDQILKLIKQFIGSDLADDYTFNIVTI